MTEAGKNRVRGSNQEQMFAGTSLLIGLPVCYDPPCEVDG
jgi:hypothetical protein